MTSALIGSSAMQGSANTFLMVPLNCMLVVTTAITDVDPRRAKTHRGPLLVSCRIHLSCGREPPAGRRVG